MIYVILAFVQEILFHYSPKFKFDTWLLIQSPEDKQTCAQSLFPVEDFDIEVTASVEDFQRGQAAYSSIL